MNCDCIFMIFGDTFTVFLKFSASWKNTKFKIVNCRMFSDEFIP